MSMDVGANDRQMNRAGGQPTGGSPGPAAGRRWTAVSEIIGACLSGDSDAWETFVRCVHPCVLGVFRDLSQDENAAEDLAQEFFLQLLHDDCRLLRAYNPATGVPMATYLRVIAYRLYLSRPGSRGTRGDGGAGVELAPVGGDAAGRSTGGLSRRDVRESARALPADQRTAVLLLLEGLTCAETGSIMGIGSAEVGTLVLRAGPALSMALGLRGSCGGRNEDGRAARSEWGDGLVPVE
jgi:DNA-directed RNA polymerase specialized sigma24 family protein